MSSTSGGGHDIHHPRDQHPSADEAAEIGAAQRLTRDPAALSAIIAQLPDARAAAALKALAPAITRAHRRLNLLEALHHSGRLTRGHPHL